MTDFAAFNVCYCPRYDQQYLSGDLELISHPDERETSFDGAMTDIAMAQSFPALSSLVHIPQPYAMYDFVQPLISARPPVLASTTAIPLQDRDNQGFAFDMAASTADGTTFHRSNEATVLPVQQGHQLIPSSVTSTPSWTPSVNLQEIGPGPKASQGADPSVPSRARSPNAKESTKPSRQDNQGDLRCPYPGCTRVAGFSKRSALNQHHKRHTTALFCKYSTCPRADGKGFSNKQDRLRHEAKHNPDIPCEEAGCDRLFSRVDNMVDAQFASYILNLVKTD